jgi:hypothetical protein
MGWQIPLLATKQPIGAVIQAGQPIGQIVNDEKLVAMMGRGQQIDSEL